MEYAIAHTKRELEDVLKQVSQTELPLKLYWEQILPKATHDQYKLLFGLLYKTIAEYTGHSIQEIHRAYMNEFNLEYSPLPSNPTEFVFRVKSGTEFDVLTIGMYYEKVAAKALTDFPGLRIPEANEI